MVSDRNEWISFEDLKDRFGARISDNSGNSFVYQYAYADNQIIISLRNDTGWFTEYRLDKNGNLVGWKKPEGNHLKFEFDTLNRLIMASDSSGYVLNYKYKGKTDLPLEMKDSLGRKTGFTYDERNNLIAIDSPGQEKVFFERFENGIIKQQKQGKVIVSTIAIDDFGNPVMGRRGTNAEKTFSYDKAGRVAKEILGSGEVYEYKYNDFDQLSQIYRNGEELLEYSYDPWGYKNEIRDIKGGIFKYAYDAFGLLQKATMPGGLEFTVEKLQEKYALKRIFPNKATKIYRYNYAGRLTEIIDPFGNKTKIDWTPSLLKDRITDAEGNFVQYIYDETGKVIEKRYSNGESHVFRYNSNNIVSIQSPVFNQKYFYNEQDNLASIEDKIIGINLRYKYDRLARLKSISIGEIGTIEYEYDDNDQISKIIDPESQTTCYTYDRAGRVEKVVYPNGIRKIYTYQDKLGGPVSLVFESDEKILFKERYFYDKDGLLRETRDEIEKITHSYTYNKRGELVEYERRSGANTSKKKSFSYDNNGNLVKEIQGNHKALYEYTGIGQLTKNEKGSVRHDRNGNLTATVLKKGKYNFEYDPDNRLRKAELPDGSYKKYRYDPLGRLIGWRKAKEERHILWTGKDRLLELDGRKKLVKFYVHGRDLDEIISIKRDKKYYFHQDRLGSVRLLTDEKGRVVARHNYLPFGTSIVKDESKPELMDNSVFAGSQYDPDIGCFYMRARFYNPELKRFMTKDPIEGALSMPLTWNPYLYALNNPVNLTDPEGEFVLAVIGGIIVYGTMAVAAGAAAYGAYKTGEKGLQVARTIRDEGIGPSIDRAGRAAGQRVMGAAETVAGSNISSYRESRNMNDNTPAGIANTPEGFSDTQKGLKNAGELVDHGIGVSYGSVGAEATRMVASATNPNEREAFREVAQHQANIIDLGLRAAGTKIKGVTDEAFQKKIDSTPIGEHFKDLGDSAQAVADKLPIVGSFVKGQFEEVAQAVYDEAAKGPKQGEKKSPVTPPVTPPATPPKPSDEPPKLPEEPPAPAVKPPPVEPPSVEPPVIPPVEPPVTPPEEPPVTPPPEEPPQPPGEKGPIKPGRGEEGDTV
ncbi:MAG: RHS repeat domain-containing protein, partial [Desulfobacterales bacterium]